ncbi:hypothetical protein AX14_007624 [Amanita brunnescens Koide BX004]|nr:hypothetical protein AX14_007624 [Amanita brunnescens Koide BX004]
MLRLASLVALAVVVLSTSAAANRLEGFFQVPSAAIRSSCDASSPPSCSASGDVSGTCCYESPGGLISLVQFWETHPPDGPSDSWTIHGLWPDNCDGSYGQDCDSSRAYTDIAGLLENQGAGDTLSFMKKYWPDYHGQNEQFWEHEWSKHGTCYSTLNPSCLPQGSPTGAEAVAFFQTVTGLFKQYDIYNALANAGITPSNQKSYSRDDLQAALSSAFGVAPGFDCTGHKYLNQALIYFHLQGSIIDGTFIPIDAPSAGNCPDEIQYELKYQHQ